MSTTPHQHPDDIHHVALDAVAAMRRAISISDVAPWGEYDADPQVDPKASKDGFLSLLDQVETMHQSILDARDLGAQAPRDHTDPRSPDEILTDFGQGMRGQADVDMFGLVHEIIADIQSSYRLAMDAAGITAEVSGEVEGTVTDYVTNHYGEV